MEMWTGCVAGALLDKEYIIKLKQAGFTDPSVEEIKIYTKADVYCPNFCELIVQIEELTKSETGCCKSSGEKFGKDIISAMAENVMSAFIKATKQGKYSFSVNDKNMKI